MVLNASDREATVTLPVDPSGWTEAFGAGEEPLPNASIPATDGRVWVRVK